MSSVPTDPEFPQSPNAPRACAVIMGRTVLENRWATERWAPCAVIEDDPAGPRAPYCLETGPAGDRWLHPGFTVALYTDEAEGYWLNLTAPTPFVFVNWELVDGTGIPRSVTVSYHEAARQMDGGAEVEGVPLPADWLPWIAAFTDRHYRPEVKKPRARPPSFKGARRDE
jgi:hypothetical protein